MKLFREIIIIFGISYIGECLSTLLHLPLPGSLVEMLLLLLLLSFRILRLDMIATVSDFLLGHLPFFFIPAGVALMAKFYHIADIWIPILLICMVTTVITMGLSGWSMQQVMEKWGKKHG